MPSVRVHPSRRPAAVAPSHRAEEPRVQLGDEADHRAPLRGNDVGVETPIPRLDLALDQDHLRFRVRRDQVLGEGDGGRVGAHGAVAAQQANPVSAGEVGPLAKVFGVHGLVPHVAVADVGEEGGGVVAVVAQDVQGCLHCRAPEGVGPVAVCLRNVDMRSKLSMEIILV